MGYDQPISIQYLNWLKKALKFDFGISSMSQRPVVDEILMAIPRTLILTGISILFLIFITVPLGILAAIFRGSFIDKFADLVSVAGTAVPGFWLGLLLIQIFAVKLNIFPTMGMGGLKHLFLPALTLGINMAPPYVRLLRQSILQSKEKDFVRSARAKGVKESTIFFKHILRDSLMPVLTVFGVSIGSLLGGAVVVEVIFGFPGMGKLAVDAIGHNDYNLIQAYLIFLGLGVYIINNLMDLSYRFVDPSIKIKGDESR